VTTIFEKTLPWRELTTLERTTVARTRTNFPAAQYGSQVL